MGFVSLHDLAKKGRKSPGKGNMPIPAVAVTQAYYESREACILTVRISPEGMDSARLKKGDKVDVQYDPESNFWRVKLSVGGKGYAISGTAKSETGVVRFTHYEGMPLIAERQARKVRAFADEQTIQYGAGEVTFSLLQPEQDDSED